MTGCAWYASKSTCYSDGSDAKDFSGNSAVVYGDAQWWITDALVAPTELGSYVLQWRWDNEQTPQAVASPSGTVTATAAAAGDTTDATMLPTFDSGALAHTTAGPWNDASATTDAVCQSNFQLLYPLQHAWLVP